MYFKILIDAWAFIQIMVDAEVGIGRLLEATVLKWDKQLCEMIFVQIYLHYITAKGKTFEKGYRISLKSGDGPLIESLFLAHLSKAQSELLWLPYVCRPSCVVRRALSVINFLLKWHLLLNHWAIFHQTYRNVPVMVLYENCPKN